MPREVLQEPAFVLEQGSSMPMNDSHIATSEQRGQAFFDLQSGAFFRRVDWSAFWVVWGVAFLLYLFTLAPSVTLEDSGELAVAADHMGVPHPPGYPLWTLLAWLFQRVFHGITYHGYPNPAWAIGLMSATFASLACGLLALLVSRSGTDMMRGLQRTTHLLGLNIETKVCWTAGVTAGLLLAFSPVLWSQAVIIEVYALNSFFMILLLLMIYRWMSRPNEDLTLYVTAYLFGLGLTNHHTLFFLAPAVLFAIGFRDRALFRDSVALLSLGLAGGLIYRGYTADPPPPGAIASGWNLNYVAATFFALVPLVLATWQRRLFTEWRRILLGIGAVALGLSFYLYMPVASEQNPPHNWGYTRTFQGFMHALTRGQYEQISPADILGNPRLFGQQIRTYFQSVRAQFTWASMALAVVPFFFMVTLKRKARTWLLTLITAFFFVSVMLVIFLNPTLDIQTLFIQRRFLILSHAVYAIWLGYSIVFTLSLLEVQAARLGRLRTLNVAALALAWLLPLSVLWQNFFNEEQIKTIGGAEQRGHDFGWQFGHWQLEGVHGIRADLERLYGPDKFPEVWADYPTPDYPPRLKPDAILLGGTDPGRFVPTYMIYSAQCRPDVYLITQNALADNTYMAFLRDLYGNDIWIPAQLDTNRAFQQYVQDVQAGRVDPGADVVMRDGRVSVQGVAGVMMINSILCRMLFEHNKDRHPFYVEESYVIQWMYPYLEPHGLILRLHPEPIELSDERMAQDRAFWDWYTARLLENRRFRRDIVARKSFSKLRSAIAGIYAFRRNFDEAEHAFQQAIDLYPLSPEAHFRLAEMYMQLRRLDEARMTIEALLADDPHNNRVAAFHQQLVQLQAQDQRRRELEAIFQAGPGDMETALELVQVYHRLQMQGPFQQLVVNLIQNDQIPVGTYLRLAQIMQEAGRHDLLEMALQRYVDREPRSPRAWLDLAAVRLARDRPDDALRALQQAVRLGGTPVRDAVRRDPRFQPLHNRPEFRQLLTTTDGPGPTNQPPLQFPSRPVQ